jgi:hypothetical protein
MFGIERLLAQSGRNTHRAPSWRQLRRRVIAVRAHRVGQTFASLDDEVESLSLGGIRGAQLCPKLRLLVKPSTGQRRRRPNEGADMTRNRGKNRGIHWNNNLHLSAAR